MSAFHPFRSLSSKSSLRMSHIPAAEQATSDSPKSDQDRTWLIVLVIVTGAEFLWWATCWGLGIAPAPFTLTSVALAFVGLACVAAMGKLISPQAAAPNWLTIIPATVLIGIGASLFLPIKCAIPHLVPFWIDPVLAHAERTIMGADPWLVLDRLCGWAVVPMDRLYALWLPTQTLILFTVILRPPSAGKSRALIAYILTWFLLGVVAATICSSAGPLFYDAVFGGTAFAPLGETLRTRGAWIVLTEANRMWASLASARPGIVAGVSAVPSMHVAITVWMIFAARSFAPRATPFAIGYAALIWIGSVQLGWHYVTDGLVGAVGALAIWSVSRSVETTLSGSLPASAARGEAV